ncbi:class I SAM-dependent DNA methyltransferase [Ciceribacter ferrooxidans]|uniref:site-specific DNA-methyltransferase (adenine-specific) n=1 Tax=Ciceribacter ferrooxidans TaxID=2509717 RepID=A0A4Q2TX04_9HYPH|nr:DNA methyltransferase [Ciceribacter ferrooxidans]RYC28385.1 class I SAM-dependent DNA methyltransferase [Ciceribacter ferrooxidans]
MKGTHGNISLSISEFVARWSDQEGGQERANYSLFLTELCDVLAVAHPDPASASHEMNDYVFERRVERRVADERSEVGRIDLYKRGHFILEAKQSRQRSGFESTASISQGDLFNSHTGRTHAAELNAIDHLMIQARRQAERYATALPADHPYPPFLIVCDVGRVLELYADFSGNGRHYAQFPDAKTFRIQLADLEDPAKRDLLRAVWEAPFTLDPAQQTAKVTREIAGRLATISKALEGRGFGPRNVAIFLMRCLFTMFVEDVGLLRKKGFTELLDRCLDDPRRFTFEIDDLWKHMDQGGYSPGIGERLLRFNGKLFKNAAALPLTVDEIRLLRDASDADWCDLEPAIFGTLFEQALDANERRRLGAHYTPRAYVERVVNATIIEPLMQDWVGYQSAAERALRSGMKTAAIREMEDFLRELSSVRVLDPACGTGNFLYVALRRMKQLEGEVLKQLHDIGGDEAIAKVDNLSVKPEQFFGMELNGRAVEIAELVLWIGYIQWHLRTRTTVPPEPVIGSADHVQEKDALLTWADYPNRHLKRDRMGRPMSDQQGHEIYTFPNVSRPDWPMADFIVGNPPFIGGKDIRGRLPTGYAEALWGANPHINPSADFVMYWWDRAAELLTQKGTRLRRFGFVTTNSITQVFQRRVLERHLTATPPISILLAIPDHPWTKATKDAAAVRIAITVAGAGELQGTLRQVVGEGDLDTDEPKIVFNERIGIINADLTIGADVTKAASLSANAGLCSPGVKLHGDGFILTRAKARELGLGIRPGLERHIREYRNGRDLTARSRDVMVIDLFGLDAAFVRQAYPEIHQHLYETVREQRALTFRKSATRDAREYLERWWLFGKPRTELRPALDYINRYIATVETAKHRVFQFLDAEVMPDNMLVAIASDDAFHLGVLSSRPHVLWALRAGGRQGVGNDPRYSKSRCFDPFPFPDATMIFRSKIAALAEELDATRKLVLTENPDLTLTGLYNMLDMARSGGPLTTKERELHRRARVLILKDLHDQIDHVVMQAYGWDTALAEDEILEQLVQLNLQRATEERRGLIRWLRPEYQIEKMGPLAHRADRIQSLATARSSKPKPRFSDERKVQAAQVLALLNRSRSPLTVIEIAQEFRESSQIGPDIQDVLVSLNRLGDVETFDNGRSYVRASG